MNDSPSPTTSGMNTQSPVVEQPEVKKAITSGDDAERGQGNKGPHNYTVQAAVTASLASAADNGGPRAEVPAPEGKL